MVRVSDERFSLHRSALIRAVRGKPRASPPRPVSHYVSANGYLSSRLSPTYTATTRVSPICTMLPQPGRHDSTGSRHMPRVQSVSFHPYVTVHPADDYDRNATWMYIALDRVRFRRRIEQTELILSPILTDVHRMTIRINRLKLCDTNLRTRVANLHNVCVFSSIKEKHALYSFELFISLSSTNTTYKFMNNDIIQSIISSKIT